MSQQFTASDGRRYTIEYDLPLVRDIRKATGIDLIGSEGVQKATASVIDFAELLWHTVRLQAERQGVDEAEFIRSIQKCLDEAVDAWLQALTSFFDSVGRGALARLAESLVATERHNRAESNKLMDSQTAQRFTAIQTGAYSSARRRALEQLLGSESKNESDAATPGQPSPS